MIKLSDNFTLEELTASRTAKAKGIANIPGDEEIHNLEVLVENVLQPLRDIVQEAVKVTSGYRCVELNKAVGGAPNSYHLFGAAADIKPTKNSKYALIDWVNIIYEHLPYNELILENYPDGWVHVGYLPWRSNKKLMVQYTNGRFYELSIDELNGLA